MFDSEDTVQTFVGDISKLGMPLMMKGIAAGRSPEFPDHILLFLAFTNPLGMDHSIIIEAAKLDEFLDFIKTKSAEAIHVVKNIDVHTEAELQAMLETETD